MMDGKAALIAACCMLSGCISPWAVMPGGHPNFDSALLPPGTEVVEVPVGNDTLRGVFVPGQPGAPLVLHVLEALGSATLGCQTEVASLGICGYPVLWELQDLGFASLMLDYRGVGASSGTRHVDHLIEDTEAMWQAALARVERNPGRVVLRTISLGTIGAAALIHHGAEPAAWTAIAPIDPRTVATNVLYGTLFLPIAWLADMISTVVADVDVYTAFAAAECRVTCFRAAKGDQFVTEDEYAAIAAAVQESSGAVITLNDDHINCAGGGHWLRPEERALLRDLFGEVAPREARVARVLALTAPDGGEPERTMARLQLLSAAVDCAPELALAAARSQVAPGALIPWVAWLERGARTEGVQREVTAWQRLLAVDDDDGPLRSDVIARLAPWVASRRFELGPIAAYELTESVVDPEPDEIYRLYYGTKEVRIGIGANMMVALATCGYTPDSDRNEWGRRALATLHKAIGEPDPRCDRVPACLQRAPFAYELLARRLAQSAAAPNALAGLDPQLLWQVFLAEIPEEAATLRQAAAQRATQIVALLTQRPYYCDIPVLVTACLQDRDTDHDPRFGKMWVDLHRDRVRDMPWRVQVGLAENWTSSPWDAGAFDADEAAALSAWFSLEDIECGLAVESDDFLSQVDVLTLAAIPSRHSGANGVLEVWLRDDWRVRDAAPGRAPGQPPDSR